jgi:hypothetical protein
VHRSRVLLVVVATLLSVGAGVGWGLSRPAPASSAKSQEEGDQVHVKNPKTAAGRGAAEGIRAPWVIQENARPGTSDWRLGGGGRGSIEGYADKVSAVQGDRVTLFVSTDASSYRVEAYRIGYYSGLGGRMVWKSNQFSGSKQPKGNRETRTNMVQAQWTPSLTVPITGAWPPGDYLLKLVSANGPQQYVPLTVRDDRSTAAFVVQNSVTTWQAYNLWGGYDLYEGKNGSGGSDYEHRSRVVSFDRPYAMGGGSGDFLGNEFPLVSLVESLGLDVTYWTDVDLHERGSLLTKHRSLLSLGHDEYWSRAMRDNAQQARDRGVNLAFLGANAVFRHIRLEPSAIGPDRHQVDYKQAREDPMYLTDKKEVTSDWREAPVAEPESTLIGDLYECNPVKADMVIADDGAWVFAGTGLGRGDRLHQVVGPEYDRYDPGVPGPRNVQVLAHSPLRCGGKSSYSDMTYYTSENSGAGVFATGTNWWISKLSQDCPSDATYTCPKDAVVKITTNVLNVLGAGPAGLAHPSTGTKLKDLPTGVPDTSDSTVVSTPRRRTTRTSIYYYYPQTRTTQAPTPPPTYYYLPPQPPPTHYTPTTRPRTLLGR